MVIPCFSYRLWFGVIVKLIWNSVVLIVRIKHISLLEITLFLIYMSWYEKLEKVREFVCDEEIITAMGNYFNSDQMEDFVNELIINYDLDSEFPEDED